MDRSLVRFHAGIKSEKTRKTYDVEFGRFLRFVKIKEAGGLLQLKTEYLQELVEDYVINLKDRGLRYNSVNCAMSAIETFMFMNDKVLNFKKIKKMYPEKQKLLGSGEWTAEEIGLMLSRTASLRNKAIILLLSCTGIRKAGVVGIRLKHIKDMADNYKTITIYPSSREEYQVFTTPETSKAIDKYLTQRKHAGENLDENSPLFRNTWRVAWVDVRPLSYDGLRSIMENVIMKMRKRGDGTRHEQATFHAFRRFFNNTIKNSELGNIALKEKLMGHRGVFALDGTYHTPDVITLWNEFRLHAGELTIDNSEREKIKREMVEKKVEQLEREKDHRLSELEQRNRMLEDKLSTVHDIVEEMKRRMKN